MSASQADTQRRTSRSLLVSLLALGASFLLLQGVAIFQAGGWQALAQAPGTPTPTTPGIQFINPSETGSKNVNDEGDGDSTYHLVAWTKNAPSGATVQFKLDPGDTLIANGTSVAGDTWETRWNLNAVSEGSHKIRANLFDSNGGQIASDEITVNVNQLDDGTPLTPEEDAAETVEINYPTNGPLGIYTAAGGGKNFVFQLTTSPDDGGPTESDTDALRLEYSVTPVGEEPVWKPCSADEYTDVSGTANPDGSSTGRYRCTVVAADQPTSVTAVNVVRNDTPFPLNAGDPDPGYDDASDAHRVLAYAAVPGSVVLSSATQQRDINKCAHVTVTVLDQILHEIANANVDVHAQGPDDALKFHSAATNAWADASKAADLGHGAGDQATACALTGESGTDGGTQSEHDQTAADIKHIESSNNTDNTGKYTFALKSPIQGETQFTAFVDQDNDDLRCTDERAANGSIGWNPIAAPAPSGLPVDLATCPQPTPSGSLTPTATPTPSPSKSSPRPSASASTTPAQQTRTVTLVADKSKVTSGKTVRLSGQVLSSTTSCTDSEFVQIKRRVHGQTTFVDLESTNTDAQGAYHVDLIVQKNADYTATATAHDNCATSTSDPVTVLAKVKVFVAVEKKSVDKGDTVRVKAAVRPKHVGTKVILEYKKGRKFVKVATTKLNKKSIGKFRFKADWKGKRVFRVRWPAQDDDHEAGKSKTIAVTSKT